nr:hypothetical protein pKpn33002_00130 [Klebsiella pneumoniae]
MLTLLVFSVIRVRKWKCVKETLAIVSFVYLLNFIKGYLKMNTNVHHVQENFYISLQDCINKEEKTKKHALSTGDVKLRGRRKKAQDVEHCL